MRKQHCCPSLIYMLTLYRVYAWTSVLCGAHGLYNYIDTYICNVPHLLFMTRFF